MQFSSAMRVLLYLLVTPAAAFAAGPATAPAAVASSPKEALKAWAALADLDSLGKIYHAQTADDRHLAHSLALQACATLKLQKAVAARWGKDSETAVAHLCGNDTPQDDDDAFEVIDGDRAKIIFKPIAVNPLLVVRVDGRWLIDVPSISRMLGSRLERDDQIVEQSARLYTRYAAAIEAGKYPAFKEMGESLDAEIRALSNSAH